MPPSTIPGGDQAGLRAYNRRLIIDLIRQSGPMPKAEIARATGLTAQSASVIVNALLKEGLVRKEEKVRGRVGQPSTPIALAPEGALSIGVKIGRRSLELALVDFLGEVILAREARYDVPRCADVMARLASEAAALMSGVTPAQHARIIGVGVAAPGTLSGWGDVLELGPRELQDWDEVDITGTVHTLFGLPAEMWNDATAACAAEMMLGRAMEFSSALYIYVGTFIGGGVVLEGRLLEGTRANAGAIGSMPVPGPAGPEQLIRQASLLGLDRSLASAGIGSAGEMREKVRMARSHPAWLDWRARAARGIAHAIAASAAVIDFEGVVIDAMLDSVDVEALTEETRRAFAQIDVTGTSPLEIRAGTIGFAARSLGAAILPIVRSFSPDRELLVKRRAAP
ncbi:ROK family transcriptional regulator [Paroceanicella profunda]|uniref:ROK family transcriptional regulator n=1 Tax=Paroceanicella profunda TaxID=2579971 RepID=A0A5B8FVM9_9RHOB|nr:ROK family transcriptional regulator [Paroceanicella profunda]QDL91424.1 ROK family transcriptional regulator [Paroceanicella profunda]